MTKNLVYSAKWHLWHEIVYFYFTLWLIQHNGFCAVYMSDLNQDIETKRIGLHGISMGGACGGGTERHLLPFSSAVSATTTLSYQEDYTMCSFWH